MPYPQIVEYNEAVQHPAQAFVDSELKRGSVKETNLGLPLVLSGGFALTYTLSTPSKKYTVLWGVESDETHIWSFVVNTDRSPNIQLDGLMAEGDELYSNILRVCRSLETVN
jgi:hypothetical protein